MEYRFQYELNFEELIIFNKICARMNRRWWVPLFRLLCLIVGGMAAIAGVSFFMARNYLSAVIEVLCAIVLLRATLFYYRVCARRSQKLHLKGAGESVVILNDEGVSDTDKKSERLYHWDAFIGLYYSRGCYFLFLDKNHAEILPERVMPKGIAPQVEEFLIRKTGKELIKW